MAATVENFKKHIQLDENMDDGIIGTYLEAAKNYVRNATDQEDEVLVYLVTSIFYQFRVPEEEMGKAFDAITPLIVQGAMTSAKSTEE
ncbi:phage gp6-like head-tail connector protein [Listeria booriae]|uniref:head-tail connector protein n=1 Tax=Listeria booriae TaxID=1552123 RepID=UPI001629AE62|nr:head-tail connector protein [Listeria booriae]MBC2367829.1 phage gp6-like head-tail connector protein [Listeria booriae]